MRRSKGEKDIADEVKNLTEENRRLEERVEELEATILEYQHKLGRKPIQEITLKDYLDGLNNRKYDGKRVVIKEAKVSAPVSKKDWLFFSHYLQFNVHSDEAEASFIHWCPKKHKPIIEDILDSVVNTNYKIIVIAHGKNYFIEGIVKEDGEKKYFDDL